MNNCELCDDIRLSREALVLLAADPTLARAACGRGGRDFAACRGQHQHDIGFLPPGGRRSCIACTPRPRSPRSTALPHCRSRTPTSRHTSSRRSRPTRPSSRRRSTRRRVKASFVHVTLSPASRAILVVNENIVVGERIGRVTLWGTDQELHDELSRNLVVLAACGHRLLSSASASACACRTGSAGDRCAPHHRVFGGSGGARLQPQVFKKVRAFLRSTTTKSAGSSSPSTACSKSSRLDEKRVAEHRRRAGKEVAVSYHRARRRAQIKAGCDARAKADFLVNTSHEDPARR